MERNKLRAIFDERCINVAAFSRENRIKVTTLRSILNESKDPCMTSIDNWLKIADGLHIDPRQLYEMVRRDE